VTSGLSAIVATRVIISLREYLVPFRGAAPDVLEGSRAAGGKTGLQPVVENRESEGLNARPIWFGPTDQLLFGWLRLPEEASAGVVLCRPIGLEALSAHRAYRYLA